VPTRMVDDPMNDRQSQSGSRTHSFGREEGFEEAGLNLLGHPAAGVACRQLDKTSCLQIRVVGEILFPNRERTGFDGQPPAPGHCISGVDREVDQYLFELPLISGDRVLNRVEDECDFDIVSEQPAKHLGGFGDDRIQVQCLWLDH